MLACWLRLAAVAALCAAAATSTSDEQHAEALQHLNLTLHGRVRSNTPFALPCFSRYNGHAVHRDDAACSAVQANYSSPDFRTEFPGAYMNVQDSMCASDPHDQCVLDNTNPYNAKAYAHKDCRQGSVPPAYIEVRDEHDVAAAFKFASKVGIPLAIKNSGHSFAGQSSQRGALALWTRQLQKLSFDESFVPSGCPKSRQGSRAITTGAGVNCEEAYKYADSVDSTIICGAAATVGIGGGWVQGAGHSVMSNVYGLGVDRVLEFKVVTPDGKYRTVNECQNQDLFWALRGGGGGTFGVVLESTHLVEPSMPITVADISFPSPNATNLYDWMKILVDTAVDLAEAGWGGHIAGPSILYVNPKLSVADAKKGMAKISAYAKRMGGKVDIHESKVWYDFYEEYVPQNSVAVGKVSFANSRLLPKSTFTKRCARARLMKFIKEFLDAGGSPYVPVDTPYLFKAEKNSTSVTPAWRDAVWSFGATTGTWAWNATLEERRASVTNMNKHAAELRDLSPGGGGAYMYEASPFLEGWREDYWRENYAPLLTVKNKYDPHRLLSCWHCVGWEEEMAQSSCYKKLV